jgi:hypothetical protein
MLTGCSTLKNAYDSVLSEPDITADVVTPSGEQLDSDDLNILISQPYIDPLTRFIARHKDNKEKARQVEVAFTEQQKRCTQAVERLMSNKPEPGQRTRFIRGYEFSCPIQVARLKTELSDSETTVDLHQDSSHNTLSEQDTKQVSDCYLLLSIKNYTEAKSMCLPLIARGDITATEGIAEIAYMEEDYAYAMALAEPIAKDSARLSYLMGQMYEFGYNVEVSVQSARDWYLLAQQLGHPDAQVALSNLESR